MGAGRGRGRRWGRGKGGFANLDGGGGGGWGAGEVEEASGGWGAFHAGCVNAFLAAALLRVMHAAVPIPAVAAASVLHSAALVNLSQVMWGPSRHLGSLTAASWMSFDFNVSYSSC